MKIYFDITFDGRIWPDWDSNKTGSVGIKWVGPLGMLDILETLLGLKGPISPDSIRAAGIVPELSKNENAFWVKSSQVSTRSKIDKQSPRLKNFKHRRQ